MTVRHATYEDMPAVMEMTRKLYAGSDYVNEIPFDDESADPLIRMSMDQNLCSVMEKNNHAVGTIWGVASPYPLNKNYLYGTEIAWWVDPEWRGHGIGLMRHIEKSARNAGIRMWIMGSHDPMNSEMLGKIYEKRGYCPVERTFARYF